MLNIFFFNDTATTEIYTLSLHDALPICFEPARGLVNLQREDGERGLVVERAAVVVRRLLARRARGEEDRKSTRLNSSHANISYAVFCLKKKKILPLLPLILSCI